ncbi:DNA-binding protein [Mycolicibacterium sp. 018/SC-01/001]|uniref:Zn-ribbon domain-containing OB-fold protein n=1 Tax=Mycolicibacterium sp. 018/SC-01/001 TaxID=2592069 RepID=UPI00117F4B84|nr:OB-fold domain-containing protein [Mycolicibacterium sp. 018/SC-01/001]TRW76750.1 DNA-binding protein [Mycolicibacterium sp. 018/SC-01/001]
MPDSSAGETVRPVPALTEVNAPFWTSGERGELCLQRCDGCARLVHPPALRCPYDHAPGTETTLQHVTLSGRGRVESWTVNEHQWFPGFPAPYVVAFVTPVEDDRVRILTNLVDVDPSRVSENMPVRVVFEEAPPPDASHDSDERVFVPLFEPDR